MDFTNFEGKTVDDAITAASVALGVTSSEMEYEVVEEGSSGFLGINRKPAVIKARKKSVAASLNETVESFLKQLFATMGVETQIEIQINDEEKVMEINLTGNDMGVLIGKRGQTLDALQKITQSVVNKNNTEEFLRVKLDTENYRARRKDTLENLARNIAYKVRKTRKSVTLEPMNPYERRIIHSALQGDKYVSTRSEGEEPYRQVVIYYNHQK